MITLQYTASELEGLARKAAEAARHMRAHPDLPGPISRGFGVSGMPRVQSVADLLAWAKTFDRPQIVLTGNSVFATGVGDTLQIVADLEGDLHRWCDPLSGQSEITVTQLAAYVAAGTVEHAGEVLV